jgi:hypothetical protein
MTTITNASGGLTYRPALARGVAVYNGLRGLMDIGSSNHPSSEIAKWRGTAVASVLGQLAVTVTGASAQLLSACCGIARQRNSIEGIEPVFLSALLGTTEGAPELDLADAAWAALPSPAVAGDQLIPILDPSLAELAFVAPHDLEVMTGLALKAQLSSLRKSHAVPAGDTGEELAFAAAVLLCATAVMSASVLTRVPDSDPQKAAALAALPPGSGSPALAQQLVRGTALLVQIELLADNGDLTPSQPADWASVWPTIEALPSDADPSPTVSHPYWRGSQLGPSLPVTGPALSGQILCRDSTLLMQSVPRIALDGTVLDQGFYPRPAPPTPPTAEDGGWRATIGQLYLPHVRSGSQKLLGGVVLDPVTGNRVDPVTGLPVPGSGGGGESIGAAVRLQLARAVQLGRYSTSESLGHVLERVAATDYTAPEQG